MKFLSFESRITIPQAIAAAILGMIYAIIIIDAFYLTESIYQASIDTLDFLKNLFRQWVISVMG
jgi:hypothetical protein